MRLTNAFTVPAPPERAWDVLLDLERVAPCLPGAALEGRDGDEHRGTMTVKIGPITARYAGTVRIEEADAAARRAVMRAQARDARGQGTAAATIATALAPDGDGTRVTVETDLRVTGPAAQFGRGVMQDVSGKLMGRFADCLAEEIAGAGAAGLASDSGAAAGARAPLPPGPASESVGWTREPLGPAPERAPADVLDLGAAAGGALARRVLPLVAGVAALALLVRLARRR